MRASDQTQTDLASAKGKVKPAQQSITHIAWTNVNIKPKAKSGLEKFASIMTPKETVIFKGQPKYVTKHAIIVGKPFTMSVVGRSVAEATQLANKKATEELEGIRYVLKTSNLLAPSRTKSI